MCSPHGDRHCMHGSSPFYGLCKYFMLDPSNILATHHPSTHAVASQAPLAVVMGTWVFGFSYYPRKEVGLAVVWWGTESPDESKP